MELLTFYMISNVKDHFMDRIEWKNLCEMKGGGGGWVGSFPSAPSLHIGCVWLVLSLSLGVCAGTVLLVPSSGGNNCLMLFLLSWSNTGSPQKARDSKAGKKRVKWREAVALAVTAPTRGLWGGCFLVTRTSIVTRHSDRLHKQSP